MNIFNIAIPPELLLIVGLIIIILLVRVWCISKNLRLLRETTLSVTVGQYSMKAYDDMLQKFHKHYPNCYFVKADEIGTYSARIGLPGDFIDCLYNVTYIKK